MNKSVALSFAACLFLSACADMAEKDAPIEDRAAASKIGAASAGKGASSAATGKEDGAKTGAAGPGAGGAGAATSAGADTQGRPIDAPVETRALPGAQAGVEGTRIVATEQAATMKDPLKDPGGLLSKRVLYFDYNSTTIADEYHPLLEAHAQYLKATPSAKMILQGHTDERGSREYNLALGQRRAESVKQAMSLLGVPDERMEAVSLGEEKPLAEGHDEAAWKQNRRAEIYYQGE